MNIKKLIADLQVCADDDIICTACERYHEMKEKGGTADCVNQLLLDAAAALEKMPQWIPVTERLPENRKDVLVIAFWHEKWNVLMGWYAPNGAVWHVGLMEETDYPVSHWMPLPELPLPEPPRENTP